uniref:CCDC66 domain-containing protein n=1 Tax=Heligmosomoides polygyrus TaxID=6339 RepID=A0A183F9Z5_HELPZ
LFRAGEKVGSFEPAQVVEQEPVNSGSMLERTEASVHDRKKKDEERRKQREKELEEEKARMAERARKEKEARERAERLEQKKAHVKKLLQEAQRKAEKERKMRDLKDRAALQRKGPAPVPPPVPDHRNMAAIRPPPQRPRDQLQAESPSPPRGHGVATFTVADAEKPFHRSLRSSLQTRRLDHREDRQPHRPGRP